MASALGPTHAGGVVVRRDGADLRFLLVTARQQPTLWVLPKGHIETGETAEQAAVREVKEESGVDAVVIEELGMLEFRGRQGQVRSQFFLMEFTAEGPVAEKRHRVWMTEADARRALLYDDARQLVTQAHEVMTTTRRRSSE